MNKELRAVCEDEEVALEQLGVLTSGKLRDRLADIWAATSIDDLLIFNAQFLNTPDGPYCTIPLCDEYEINFIPNHIKKPTSTENLIDWNQVKNVQIIDIQKKTNRP